MTVSSTNRRAGPFVGNDVTVAFPFSFRMFSVEDLLVVTLDTSTGVETTLVIDLDFTAVLNADQDDAPGGTVTLVDPLPTGTKMVITSDVAPLQEVVVTNAGGFYPGVFNAVFDKLTILTQQNAEEISRALRVSVTSDADPTITPLALGVLQWNSTATGIDTIPVSDIQSSTFYASILSDILTGDGVETDFTLSGSPVTAINCIVTDSDGLNYQAGVDFTVTGTTISFTDPLPADVTAQVRFQLIVPELTAGVFSVAGLTSATISAVALRTALGLGELATFVGSGGAGTVLTWDGDSFALAAASTPAFGVDIWAGTGGKEVQPDALEVAAAPQAKAYAATLTFNGEEGISFETTLTGNCVLANPTNMPVGRSGVFWFKQDATGSRTLSRATSGSVFKIAGGTGTGNHTVPINSAANSWTAVSYFVKSDGIYLIASSGFV